MAEPLSEQHSEQRPDRTTIVPATSAGLAPGPASATGSGPGKVEDPRDRVTPEAFFVAPELLGKPLAKPAARGYAWLVDGAVVAVLSQAGPFLLAIALAVLSYQLISKRRLTVGHFEMAGMRRDKVDNEAGSDRTRAGKLPLLLSALFIGWAVFMGLDWLSDSSDRPDRATDAAASTEALPTDPATMSTEALELQALRVENQKLKAGGESFSLIDTGRRMLDDIGFGFGWAAVYFSFLTAWWQGQTLGKRMFGLRVVQLNGKRLTVWDCFNRYGGYAAGFATGLLGFAQIYWDDNRQAIHDRISFTVVLDENRN